MLPHPMDSGNAKELPKSLSPDPQSKKQAHPADALLLYGAQRLLKPDLHPVAFKLSFKR